MRIHVKKAKKNKNFIILLLTRPLTPGISVLMHQSFCSPAYQTICNLDFLAAQTKDGDVYLSFTFWCEDNRLSDKAYEFFSEAQIQKFVENLTF